MSVTNRPGAELRDQLSVVRRRKGLIMMVTFAVVGATLLLSFLQTPVYEGRARLLLQGTQSLFDSTQTNRFDYTLVQTEVQVMQSEPVRALVRERLGRAPNVTALPVGQTAVMEVRAESQRPTDAAAITNAYLEAYIDYRRDQAVGNLVKAGQELQRTIDVTQQQIDDLTKKINEVGPCSNTNLGACSEREALLRSRDTLVNQQAPFRQKLDQLQVDASLKNGGAQIVTRATVPTEPIRPRPVRSGLLALGAGLILAVCLAFLVEHLDDSIKSKEDLERAARDLPVLGLIPTVTVWKNRTEAKVVSQSEPSSPVAEAYRSLRTSINFLGLERSMRVIQITSANASEGKTTTTANLAVALARAGERVVILSCDLRRPRIHDFFELPNGVGFTSVLMGRVPLASALQQVPGEPRLQLLASGPLPPNPSELLSSVRTEQVLKALQSQAVVLIDCPPVLPVTDASVLSSKVDGTLLVATVGATTGKAFGRAVELLRQVGAPLVGTVLNGVPVEGAYGYAYQYYSRESTGKNGRKAESTNGSAQGDEGWKSPAGEAAGHS
ncbi:MAG: polysaccharide biosynthesis tyrosine autokinase [Actinomycetota bacterium]|nr:polysaccharide biosynthesis tyrosine autokinase [Actinomycetota bacterium]